MYLFAYPSYIYYSASNYQPPGIIIAHAFTRCLLAADDTTLSSSSLQSSFTAPPPPSGTSRGGWCPPLVPDLDQGRFPIFLLGKEWTTLAGPVWSRDGTLAGCDSCDVLVTSPTRASRSTCVRIGERPFVIQAYMYLRSHSTQVPTTSSLSTMRFSSFIVFAIASASAGVGEFSWVVLR